MHISWALPVYFFQIFFLLPACLIQFQTTVVLGFLYKLIFILLTPFALSPYFCQAKPTLFL